MIKWFSNDKHFNRGECFGEAALKDDKSTKLVQLRREKIKALEKTGLAVLDKEDYIEVLQKVEENTPIDTS